MDSSDHQGIEVAVGSDVDISGLLYNFDSSKPWQYFRQGKPLASSVEKGRRKLTSSEKFKKVYLPKKGRANRRKNGAFGDLDRLNLTCCDGGCLLRKGLHNVRRIIRQRRNMLYEQKYNEQNYILSKLMEVKFTHTGKRKIDYNIPLLGKVCKTAFLKVYGISKHKIQCLLKKINFEGPSIEPDQRGKVTPRKLLPAAKKAVIDFILSYEASESHYRRSRSGSKIYFEANISMRQMWSNFIREHPHLKTTSLKRKNKKGTLSFSAFRHRVEWPDIITYS